MPTDIRRKKDLVSFLFNDHKSIDFLMMMIRISEVLENTPALRLWDHDPEVDGELGDWLRRGGESAADEPEFFYVVDGELSPEFWNRYDLSDLDASLENPRRHPGFLVKGLASPYIAISEKYVTYDAPVVILDGAYFMANNLFSLFYKAAQRKDKRFTLLRTERKMSCHWAARNTRMFVMEVVPRGKTATRRGEPAKTICLEGPAEVIGKIAKNEYQNYTASSADTAIISSLLIEHMDDRVKNILMGSNLVGPYRGLSLLSLTPNRDDMAKVIHFDTAMYKAGDFLLGTNRDIEHVVRMAVELVDDLPVLKGEETSHV